MKVLILSAVIFMGMSANASRPAPPTNCKDAILNVHVKSMLAGGAEEKANANQRNANETGEFELARTMRHRNRLQNDAFEAYQLAKQLCGVGN